MTLKINKCRIVFFDLEFYFPEASRVKSGLCYNPWDKKCKLLGGAFLVANPANDFQISSEEVLKKTESFWLWTLKMKENCL